MTVTRPVPVSVGEVIAGKYRIDRVLGAGAMGVVVAAQHLGLDRQVALKFLHRDAIDNEQAVNRFLREGQALARMTSPYVARVIDVGTLDQGEPYLVMEYLRGSDLGAIVRQRGRLPVMEAVTYVLQVCEGIAEAHANGIVHRDLKPSNLFLTESADEMPLVKVLDFGISKALNDSGTGSLASDTSTGAIMGSPLYMSPEQIRNAKRVDARADIWALGVILHELLSGKLPFKAETVAGTLAAIVADPPIAIRTQCPDVPVALESAILCCLQKNRRRRYLTVAQLARAIVPFGPDGAQASLGRIDRLVSRGGPHSIIENDSSDDPSSISATFPPAELRAASERAGSVSRRRLLRSAALVVSPLLVVVPWLATRSHSGSRTAAPVGQEALQQTVESSGAGRSVSSPSIAAAMASTVELQSKGVPATSAGPDSSAGAGTAKRIRNRPRLVLNEASSDFDEEGTQERK